MLDRKLARDLTQLWGQVVTIALVVACGIAAFVASVATYQSLTGSRARYYQDAHFAELFATLKRAPNALAARIADLPGVGQVETRVVFDATLDLPGIDFPMVGRIIGLPDAGQPALNRLHLQRGRMPEAGRLDEAVVNEAFAAANNLRPGDSVAAVLNGRRQALHIVGEVLSPEFVLATNGRQPFPDDAHFGIFWVANRLAAPAFGLDGAFNDVQLTLAPGAFPAAVIAALDRLLEPYGGLGAYDRTLHPSARQLDDELRQQQVMATVIPTIFLGVAAFLISVVLGRVVATQREQIAALKALGYANAAIGLHYLKFAAVLVVAGGAAGIALGSWLGRLMTANYTQFFRFPELSFAVEPWLPLAAAAISFAAAAAGALGAVRRVVRLAPAEAMRPPAPARYGHGLVGARFVSPRVQMVLRVFTGRPLRSLLSTLGIAFAVPVIIMGLFWRDALDFMVAVQFNAVDRGHATVTFAEPVDASARRDIALMPRVTAAEAYRAVPVRLRGGQRSYRTAIQGLPAQSELHQLLDAQLAPVAVPAEGIALTDRLAERLHLALGDGVEVEVLEGKRPHATLAVTALINDIIGLSAYMNIAALNRLMREGDTISSVSVATDGDPAPELYAALKQAPKVQAVTVKAAALRVFEDTTAKFVLVFAAILTAFGAVIAVGVVYNSARVALQERAWELASLRVLGFTRAEVARILFGEIAIELIAALPIGLWLGYLLVVAMTHLFATELFRIPPVIQPRTYLAAVAVVAGAALASALMVRRRIDRLDLVSALKTRE